MRRNVYILLAVAILFLGAGVVGYYRTYRYIHRWETTEGRVFLNDLAPYTSSGVRMFRPEAELRYPVGGVTYAVPQSFPTSFPTEKEGREFVDRFAPRTLVRLRYDPAEPNRMMLADTDSSGSFLIFPTSLIATGVLLLALSLWRLHKVGRCLCPRCAISVELHDRFCYECAYPLPRQRRKLVKRL